jgi:DNA-binding MarR family transcriptional regulator
MIRGVADATGTLTDAEYGALATFRFHLRRFLHFSEEAARTAGLEPHQHQVLLALKGLGQAGCASVGQLADWLQVRHHSAVELVDRTARRGLVERVTDPADRRRVLVRLTPTGEAVLHQLSVEHQAELRSAAPDLLNSLTLLLDSTGSALLDRADPALDDSTGPALDDRADPAATADVGQPDDARAPARPAEGGSAGGACVGRP